MKTYSIKVQFSGHGFVEVEAQDAEEAEAIAAARFNSDHFHAWEVDGTEVESEQESEEPEVVT